MDNKIGSVHRFNQGGEAYYAEVIANKNGYCILWQTDKDVLHVIEPGMSEPRTRITANPESTNAHPPAPVIDVGIGEWNGEGLPPTGIECEFLSVGHHEGFIWCIYHGKLKNKEGLIIEFRSPTSEGFTIVGSFDPDFTKFRPIQSERDRVINEAKAQLVGAGDDILGILFDCGMLKLPED